MAVIALIDLQNAMSASTVLSIFEDGANGTINTASVAHVIKRAETEVYSFIKRNYPDVTVPVTADPPPAGIYNAVLEFAIVFSRDRKPEYWTSAQRGERNDRIKAAYEMAERYAKAEQIIYDAGSAPKNVGGLVASGDPDDPEPKSKVFTDGTGIF
jgi:hypothetical protein